MSGYLNGMVARHIGVFRHYLINSTVAAKYTKDTFTGHPSQKPIALIEELVKRYSKENDVIFDPFMGSGTTLRASKELGRWCIGIEIEEKYCEIAAKRLSQSVMSLEV
jgi:DNA modification methylase